MITTCVEGVSSNRCRAIKRLKRKREMGKWKRDIGCKYQNSIARSHSDPMTSQKEKEKTREKCFAQQKPPIDVLDIAFHVVRMWLPDERGSPYWMKGRKKKKKKMTNAKPRRRRSDTAFKWRKENWRPGNPVPVCAIFFPYPALRAQIQPTPTRKKPYPRKATFWPYSSSCIIEP